MKHTWEFLCAALPLVAVGLALALLFVRSAEKKKKEEKTDDYGTEGMCLGMCLGTAIGTALGNNTGIGISLAANKVPGIRAAAVSEPVSARLCKEHNNANIIAFGARIVGLEEAKAIVDAFLTESFLGGRHQRRVDMITEIEKKYSR